MADSQPEEKLEPPSTPPGMSFLAQLMATDDVQAENHLEPDVEETTLPLYSVANSTASACETWQSSTYPNTNTQSASPVHTYSSLPNADSGFIPAVAPSGFIQPPQMMQADHYCYLPNQFFSNHYFKPEDGKEHFTSAANCTTVSTQLTPLMADGNVFRSSSCSDIFPDVAFLPKQETSCDIINLCEGKSLEERYSNNYYDANYFSRYILGKNFSEPISMTEVEETPKDIPEATRKYIDYLLLENHKKLNEIVYPLIELSPERLEEERSKFMGATEKALQERNGFFPTQKFLGWVKLFGLEINVNSVGTYFLYKSGPPSVLKPQPVSRRLAKRRISAFGGLMGDSAPLDARQDMFGFGMRNSPLTKPPRKRGRPPKRRPIVADECLDDDEAEENSPKIAMPEKEAMKLNSPEETKPLVSNIEDAQKSMMEGQPNAAMIPPHGMLTSNGTMCEQLAQPWSYENMQFGGYPCMPMANYQDQMYNNGNPAFIQMNNGQYMPNEMMQYYDPSMGGDTSQSFEDDESDTDDYETEENDTSTSMILDMDNQ